MPQGIKIGDVNVTVQQIVTLLTELWQQRLLIKAFVGHTIGQEGGSLIVQEA